MCQTLLTLVFGTLVLHASGIQVAVDTYDAHCGLNNGWATAFATGGNSPYSYSWSNGASTAHIQDLAPGSYTVTVTDAVNATAQSTVTIVNIPNIDPEVVPRPACTAYGSCSGQVFVSPLDLGTAPYTYTVDPPQCTIWPPTPYLPGGVFIDYLESGQNYTITVTDANGCTGSRSAFITEIPPYQHVAAAITAECGGSGNGGFTIADLGIPVLWHVTGPNGFMGNFDYSNTPGPYVFSDLVGGEYTATPVDPWQTPNAFWCEFPAVVTVPGLLPPCGSVSGHVFHDADQDCAFNGSDIDLPYKVLTIEPGPSYVLTDANGNYHQNLDFGSYSIEQSLQQEVQLCPGNTPVPFISDGLSPDAVVDFADSSMVPHDVSVSVFAYVPRVGSPTAVHVLVKNNSAYPSGSLDVSLAYDPLLLNPSPFPAQWSIPVLAPYADTLLYFHAEVPNDVNLIGTAILYTATVTNSVNEPITTNNSDSQSEVIVAVSTRTTSMLAPAPAPAMRSTTWTWTITSTTPSVSRTLAPPVRSPLSCAIRWMPIWTSRGWRSSAHRTTSFPQSLMIACWCSPSPTSTCRTARATPWAVKDPFASAYDRVTC